MKGIFRKVCVDRQLQQKFLSWAIAKSQAINPFSQKVPDVGIVVAVAATAAVVVGTGVQHQQL